MSKGTIIILIIVGCLLLAVANLALWATLDVFNPTRFGERVAEGLQSDQATAALAGPIVDQIMEGYPDLPPLVRVPAEEVVTWLLQRPAFTPVFKQTAAVASVVMTTSAQDVIGIELPNVGSYVVAVVSVLDPEAGANAQAALESSQESGLLVIYEAGRFPKQRQVSNTVPWLWPLAGLGVIITGGLELLLIPALHAPVLNNITDPVMRTVIVEVLTVLTRGLAMQCLFLILIGLAAIVVSHNLSKKDDQAQARAASA